MSSDDKVNEECDSNKIENSDKKYISFKNVYVNLSRKQSSLKVKQHVDHQQVIQPSQEDTVQEDCEQDKIQIIQNDIFGTHLSYGALPLENEKIHLRSTKNQLSRESSKNHISLKQSRNQLMFQSTLALEDLYFVEDQKQKEEENFAKYSNDITKLKSYNMPFRFGQFLEFFLYHFIYFTFLGPLTIIITRIGGKHLGKNLCFIGNNQNFYIQLLNFIISVTSLNMYYFLDNSAINQSIYLFNLFYAVILRCLQIATKYATFDPLKIKIYKEIEIKREDFLYDIFLLDWSTQSDKMVYEQLYYTQRFFDTDPNLFYLQFMVEPSNETAIQVQKSKELINAQIEARKTHKQTEPIGVCIENQIYHNGYTILHFLLNQHKEKSAKLRKTLSYAIQILSLIRGMLPAIYALTMSMNGLGMYWNEYVINILLSNQIFTLHSAISLQICFGLLDLRRKVKQL